MKNKNSSEEEDNLRLWKNLREDVVAAAALLTEVTLKAAEGKASDSDVVQGAVAFKGAVAKLREVEILIAKHSDQFGAGGQDASPLDLDAARSEVFDRLAKIAGT